LSEKELDAGESWLRREAVCLMKAQQPRGGRIINVGSVSAKTPRPDSLPYTVTKFGLQGMTHQLTMDGRKHDIVASIIHPGATLSSFTMRRGRTQAGPGEGRTTTWWRPRTSPKSRC
jgi:NAD(P)-dependent dehydrogenase (short-subunit alcohol dehydrogenase family)